MAGNSINVNGKVDLKVNVQAESARQQIANLQKSLQQVANIELNVKGDSLTEEIQNASQAALQLQSHLNNAINVKTNNLDFSKFSASLNASVKNGGKSLQEYSDSLIALGPQGKTAFMNLANAIASSEVPLKKTNKLLDTTWDNLKKTIGWQFSSSMIHGFIGSIQQAVGYAQDLNKSLTDIRIVTGASKDQMADFAKEANLAAKKLSTTTTEYTKASLIYYQQGLSDSEVKARTETTIKMANATGTSAQKVSDQMTAIWNNYDNGTKSLTHYADVMTALGAATASSTDEIAQGLQKFASISDTVGLSYEYAASALATVTATSRESADIVGNSFKTLFSRIQGLQLGETLEDGTDLNKYSNALASVGINIKDASGQLKDMDVILDEMGASWTSLARDEKMALAQTVAGVRQYTQLMTLMENWDYFKENLNVANNSQGTLDTQASIYAESWMAASDRVRASWEGVWDSLINSDSFITVLDGISGLIGMLDTMVESFGGAGGTIALFGGLLGKAFTPQITKTIEDTAYNLKMLTPKGRQSVIDQRNKLIESMRGSIADSGTFGMGSTETRVARENLARAAEQSANRAEWRSRLNEQELMEADFLEARIAKNRNAKMQLAADIDAAEEANTNLVEDRLNGGRTKFGEWLQGSSADEAQTIIDNANKEIAAIDARKKAIEKGKEAFKEGESYSGLNQQRDEWGRKKASAINLKNRAETREQTMNNAAMIGSKFSNIFEKDIWDETSIDQDTKKMKMDYKGLQSKMKAAAAKAGFKDLNPINAMIDEVFNGISETDSVDKNRGKIRALGEQIAHSAAEEILAGITDEATRQQAQEYMDNIFKAETGREALTSYDTADDRDSARLKEMGEKKPSKIETAVDIADNAMMIMAAAQAANAFGESLKLAMNNSGSFADVLAGGVSMLSAGLSGGLEMFTTLSAVMDPVTAGIISIASVALPALISGITGFNEASQELENERNEKVLEETDALKERLDTNKQLVKSMNDAISSYESSMKSYQKGESSYEDTVAARQDLINNIQSSSEDYSPEVISKILAGDTAGATKQLYEDRSREIQASLKSIQDGEDAAGEILMQNSGMFGAYGDYAQVFLDTTAPTVINSGWYQDKNSKNAIQFLEQNMGSTIPKFTNENGVEISAIQFYDDAIKLNDDILTEPAKFIEIYDLLKSNLTQLAAEGYSDTDFYKNLESFINNNASNVEKYKQSSKDMTALQAEKAAIDAEFFTVDNLQDYSNLRQKLITENSHIEGFQEQLDIYLNSLSNLQNTEQGNLPAIYKALEGAQQDTIRSGPKGKELGLSPGLDMQTMIDLYNSMGNDLFSINFGSMTTDALSQFKKAVESIEGDLTLEAIITAVLQDGGVNSELMSILRSAQALADANTIKINLEIVSNFDPETDLFDSKKRQEFLDAYNEIMGNQKGDNDYVDSNDLSLMTSDDIADMQFQSTQIGRSAQIEDAQGRVAEWTNIANDLIEIQSQAAQAETDAYNALTGKMGNTDFADTVSENARDISRYSDLQEAVEAGKATLDDINELNTLRADLSDEGLVDAGGNLEDGIPEAIKQIDALAEAQNNLAGVNEQVATASSELASAQSDSANAHLAQQELIQKEAEYYNVDMDAVKRFAKELADSNRVVKRADESTEAFNNRLLQSALDYQENTEGLKDLQDAYKDYNSAVKKGDSGAQEKAFNNIRKAIQKITKMPLNKITKEFVDQAKASGALEKALKGDVKAIKQLEDAARESIMLDPSSDIGGILSKHFGGQVDQVKSFVSQLNQAMGEADIGQMFSDVNADLAGQIGQVFKSAVDALGGGAEGIAAATALFNSLGIGVENMGSASADMSAESDIVIDQYHTEGDGENKKTIDDGDYTDATTGNAHAEGTGFKFFNLGGGGGGSPGGGGGGGGGGGPKEPKKVANKRKSQTVKRYKRNDAKRSSAEKSKKSAENQKDYLYGESKIAQMEKINKLAEKEAKITADRIKESRKYLAEDRENLIKYMQKYGFEAEFDADGFLTNYEKAWTAVYEEIAALYEDNLLTEEEEKIEEDLNIKLEELEGALEDYENSLNELADDIEKWEETLYEMFDNKIEQMEHKVEFKLELDEDSLTYIDFLIENLGDSAVRAIDKIDLIAEKTGYLFNSIQTAYEGVEEIYALSDDPLHLFATGGADIDGLLTESQVEALRGQADSLQDFADQLREIRDTIQEQVAEVFDMWTEKVNHNISALEQYGSVMEYFKNIVDLTGNDIFGLSTNFIRQMESAQIDQSIDQMEANKAYYEQLQEMRANVEYELQKAQMSGDAERIAYWEEHLRTVEEEMQTAQDSMLASLESTLTMISDQFTVAMEDAVEAFNESIYSSGGLEGLSADYSLLREEADLMAEDYDKIYQLSKISRNINKTLDDTKIIAGKQRLNSLLSEINDLQASGVEMSKYDLEYLEAKYQLYLAQIELENSQHDKDTVRLSKDSEGNWSYVYTTNEEKVNEAQQKYEDALYEMQNKNYEYLEEMSSSVIDLTQQMNEEIAALEISDFANLEEYNARVEEIQQKYLAQIERRENELDKAITNNQNLYEKDWKAYSEMTGYKISADKDWIDSFKETTLGYLTESESVFSDFGTRITEYAATLAETLSGAAGSYFSQIEEALGAYDISIAGFGATITGTYKSIQDASDLTAKKTTDMALEMKDAFNEVVTTVGTWQDTEGLEITEMLDKIATYLKEIFDAINTSANIKTDTGGPTIGQQEATRLLSNGFEYNGEHYDFGTWTFNKRGDLNINDGEFNKEGSNLVDYHAWLATQVQEALDAYYSNPEDEGLKAVAEALIKKYWAYRSVVDRVYDPGEIESNVPKSFDTGGYTGEWGSEGKLAMLHQKELILNPDDTVNFLDALNISREIINSMIEMNARASSLGLGNMTASTIKDNSQTIEQQVTITAEFPNVSDRSEIEEAFDNLINMASQYAYRSE